ncbi:MAG TPA: hypothetical protein VFA98_03225 [Thermoanaerobaculia bacterium]|nr:hypothetical protein [Thermoanaerobaculia bacterium]
MKRLALLLFGGLLGAGSLLFGVRPCFAAPDSDAAFSRRTTGLSSTYYAIELKGGSRLYAVDKPVQKGRVYLFHRYPDGTYMSLSAAEVGRVVTLAEAPQPDRHAPGETLYIGPPLSGPSAPAPAVTAPAGPAPSDGVYADDYGYGYSGWGWGGGSVPPSRPGRMPPGRIGPNGYPILAPPGSPGSTPLPIGPNGFPVLSPQPPVASPRRPQ